MNPHPHPLQTRPGQLWPLCSNPALWEREGVEARVSGSMNTCATRHFITVQGPQPLAHAGQGLKRALKGFL